MVTRKSFNRETAAEKVVETFLERINDKIVLITGVSPNGLGAAMAMAIARASPKMLILSARSIEKANTVASNLPAAFYNPAVKVLQMDLSSLASVREAAAQLDELVDHIDVLVNNAGVMGIPGRQLSKDGVEMHLATNWLGHFVFTNLILPKLLAAGARNPDFGARVINITSAGFVLTPFRFSDFNFDGNIALPKDEEPDVEVARQMGIPDVKPDGGYMPMLAYAQSGTANMLFTTHLANATKGKALHVFSAAPGVVETELQRYLPPGFRNPHMVYKTPSQGVATFVVAAFDPSLQDCSGAFIDDCQVAQAVPHATDPEAAARLWALGEKLAGETYEIQ